MIFKNELSKIVIAVISMPIFMTINVLKFIFIVLEVFLLLSVLQSTLQKYFFEFIFTEFDAQSS